MIEPVTLIRGGRVLVGDESSLRPADITASGGRITAISPPGDADHECADEVIDIDGRVLLPGFVDGHCHLELTATAMQFQLPVHTPPYDDIAGILTAIERARASTPSGWIIARGSFGLQNKVADGRLPRRDELDAASPGQPVVVLAGLHVACVNTAAMEQLGLADDQPLPDWISRDRDACGHTGAFTEVWDRLPTADVDDVMAALRAHAVPVFSRAGITSLSTIPTSAADVRALHRLTRAGELPFRVRFYPHVPRTATLDDVLAWGTESGFGDEWLRFGGVKIFVDGEGADTMGHCRDDIKWAPEELFSFVDRADEAGIQVMMHAVTPAAIRFACDAVGQARNRRDSRVRHRIEHAADYIPVADLPLAEQAGVGLVGTPHFANSAEPGSPDFQPLRAIIDGGHRVIGGTDATGTVPEATTPLYNIAAAAGRLEPDGTPSRHRTTVLEAIRMFTAWSAHGVNEEHEKGRIAPGLLADFVVLRDDPFTIPIAEIGTIEVDRTIVGGRTISSAS